MSDVTLVVNPTYQQINLEVQPPGFPSGSTPDDIWVAGIGWTNFESYALSKDYRKIIPITQADYNALPRPLDSDIFYAIRNP